MAFARVVSKYTRYVFRQSKCLDRLSSPHPGPEDKKKQKKDVLSKEGMNLMHSWATFFLNQF